MKGKKNTTANTLQKTNVKTLRASFATEPLSAQCGHKQKARQTEEQ